MDWIIYALDYLFGVPIIGLGTMVGFVWKALLLLVALLVFTAYILLADRKIWAAVQIRRGPNVVGAFGLLQSFADLLKFVLKEPVIPAGSDKTVFLLAPLVTVLLALAAWAVVPLDEGWALADINIDTELARAGLVASRVHCVRCHVISEDTRMTSIDSTPSFFLLRAFDDWEYRFQVFYILNPHPAFTQVEGVTEPFPISRPSPIVPVEMTVDEVEAIVAYVAGLEPADLGAPLQHQ